MVSSGDIRQRQNLLDIARLKLNSTVAQAEHVDIQTSVTSRTSYNLSDLAPLVAFLWKKYRIYRMYALKNTVFQNAADTSPIFGDL